MEKQFTQDIADMDLMIDPFNDEDLMTDTLGPSYTDASQADSAPEFSMEMYIDTKEVQEIDISKFMNQPYQTPQLQDPVSQPELFMINQSSIIDRINADSASLNKEAEEMYFDPTNVPNTNGGFETDFVASSDDNLSEKMRSTTKNLASLSNVEAPMLDLQQYNPTKASQMKQSESLFGKMENDDFQSKDQTDRKSENSSTSLNKSRTSGSSGESIFSTSKQETIYTEDFQQISSIFDKALFDQINAVDHIRDVERHLEEMKTQISDKKRLQKERNVLTAQLSRDRKKLENELLREKAIQLTRTLNLVRNKILDAKCKSCAADFIFADCKQYLDTSNNRTLSDTISEQSDSKIDFEKYAKKPNLVNRITQQSSKENQKGRITKKNKEVTRVTTADRSSKSKRKNKEIGKRDTTPFEYQGVPSLDTESASDSTSAFQMIPLFGGKQTGKSKFAKIGMAAASILAVSTCLLGVFGESGGASTAISPVMEDPIYINDFSEGSKRRNLQEMNSTMPPQKVKLDQNWSVDFEKVLAQINPEEQEKALTLAPTPCNNIFKAREFLEQTNRLEGMREDFLYRELVKMCKESGQENLYAEQLWRRKVKEDVIEVKEAQNSPAIYNSKPDGEPKQPFHLLENSKSMKIKKAGFCDVDNHKNQLEQLNDLTTTLSCANPSLILPHDKNGNAKMLNMTKNGDNQYLHIVLPANELNILNQHGEIGNSSAADQNTFVEIGCKIFEINHLQGETI